MTANAAGAADLHYDVLIVGAGHAGAAAAIALRQAKFSGEIALVGDEPEFPYERPPLSKDYLAGLKPFERILIRPAQFWSDQGIVMMRGRRVATVAVEPGRVTLADGAAIGYGKLIWATGGAPRRLSCQGHDLAGIHTVRTKADVDRLSAELSSAGRIVVVGGGYIGLEAAAALSGSGASITLVEAMDRVLARVAGETLSRFFEDLHRRNGVEIRLSESVDRIEGVAGRVSGVRLASGELLPCQLVIVGIGIVPEVEPLRLAGASCPNGVEVDGHCRTNLPNVFAIGDCALHRNVYASAPLIRLESVQNANDQAAIVAQALAAEGAPPSYCAVPWFWSNQYETRLQTVGLSAGHDRAVVRGDPALGSFSVIYLRESRVIALDCVNAVKDFVQGKSLVAAGVSLPEAVLRDTAHSLKDAAGSAGTAH